MGEEAGVREAVEGIPEDFEVSVDEGRAVVIR
jgi:hypothetical protein